MFNRSGNSDNNLCYTESWDIVELRSIGSLRILPGVEMLVLASISLLRRTSTRRLKCVRKSMPTMARDTSAVMNGHAKGLLRFRLSVNNLLPYV